MHGIEATPSFVIDGTTYRNMGWEEFSALLDEKVAAAG
jgi:protein-disulfide isomerase